MSVTSQGASTKPMAEADSSPAGEFSWEKFYERSSGTPKVKIEAGAGGLPLPAEQYYNSHPAPERFAKISACNTCISASCSSCSVSFNPSALGEKRTEAVVEKEISAPASVEPAVQKGLFSAFSLFIR